MTAIYNTHIISTVEGFCEYGNEPYIIFSGTHRKLWADRLALLFCFPRSRFQIIIQRPPKWMKVFRYFSQALQANASTVLTLSHLYFLQYSCQFIMHYSSLFLLLDSAPN